MDPRLTLITLGVADVARARRFYGALGFPLALEAGDFTLYDLGGLGLALYPRTLLADDARLREGTGFGGVTLAHNVRTEAEVAQVLDEAVRAGGRLLKPATRAEWGGLSGYFADPDGHPWEVAHNPALKLDRAGRLVFAKPRAKRPARKKK